MTARRFGLTPKMKPVSPKRAAVVACLDIGTAGRLSDRAARASGAARRSAPAQPRRASVGLAHTAASGMKAGSVIDLVEAEQMVRWQSTLLESTAGVELDSSLCRCPAAASAASDSSPILIWRGEQVRSR